MSKAIVEMDGVLRDDGTIVLDAKPEMPPCRVRVTIHNMDALTQTPIWQFAERIWKEQAACGHVSRSKEEIDADLAAMREEDEERMQALERIHEECEQARRAARPEAS